MTAYEARRRWLLRSAAATFAAGLGGAGLTGCGGGSAEGAAGGDAAGPLAADPTQNAQILAGVDSGGTGLVASYFSAVLSAVSPPVLADVAFGMGQCILSDADGLPVAVSDLARGMTAEVKSTPVTTVAGTARAEALTMRVGEQLIGPISAIDPGGTSFTVLGQRVVIKASTAFATTPAAAAADLAVGLLVRVWGRQDIAGASIVATRVDLPPAGAAAVFVLRGPYSAVSSRRIAIGGYQLEVPEGVALPDGLATGDLVRARLSGGASPALLSLSADGLVLPRRARADIEGRIGALEGTQRFWVDGVRVDISAATTLPAAGTLQPGLAVRVRGVAGGSGLMATSVTIEAEDGGDAIVELEGSINNVDAAARSFVLNGVTVTWTDATQFVGGGPALLARLRKVNVKGPRGSDKSRLQASSIHVEA